MTDADRRTFLAQSAATLAALALEPDAAALLRTPPPRGAPLRVGLIGVGRWGRAILGELQQIEQVEVTALCDTAKARLEAGQRRVPGATAFADHRALLDARTCDAVIVATPTHLHRGPAVDALAAGLHVWCEAPLAATLDDARAIARAARGQKAICQAGLLARSNPIYALARSFFRGGALQDVVSLRAQEHAKTSWRVPAADPSQEKALNWRLDPEHSLGLPGELGTHQLDVLHWFLGRYPASVRGSGAVLGHKDGRGVADTVHCDFEFEGGMHLAWQATLANSYEGRYELLTGTMAAIKLAWTAGWMFKEADAPTQGWEVYANRQSFHNDEGITLIANATKLAEQGKLKEGVGLPHPPLYYGLVDFVEACGAGSAPACTAEEGYRATAVGILAQQAVVTDKTVAIAAELLEVG